MVTKNSGRKSPDGSDYATFTDGNGNLLTISGTSSSTTKQTKGIHAPDGSLYMTLTDGNGNLI